MEKAIVLTTVLLAGCATPQQRQVQNPVEVYRNLISAELDEALRSPENIPIAEAFLAIDHLERKGDEAVRQGKSALAKAYYELALKNIDRWTAAFAGALHIWYINNIMPEHAASKPEATSDVQKILDMDNGIRLSTGDALFRNRKRLWEKIQVLGSDSKEIQ